MRFSEQLPLNQWAGLKYRGETVAKVWFEPEGESFALTFRITQESFRIPGMGPWLTPENLLKAVGIATEEVESWHPEGVSPSGMSGAHAELRTPLLPPPPEVPDLKLYVKLKPPARAVALRENGQPEIPEAKWQALEAGWNAILGVEAGIDTLRLQMEGARVELQAAWSKELTPEEKLHALRADVVQWTARKKRIHFTLPKMRDFIHRATWALGIPERKHLGELFETYIQPRIPFPQIAKVEEELEHLLKTRQVLSAQGAVVYKEYKTVLAEIQAALRTLQNNAATNARRKRDSNRPGGKFFKDVRKWTTGR